MVALRAEDGERTHKQRYGVVIVADLWRAASDIQAFCCGGHYWRSAQENGRVDLSPKFLPGARYQIFLRVRSRQAHYALNVHEVAVVGCSVWPTRNLSD